MGNWRPGCKAHARGILLAERDMPARKHRHADPALHCRLFCHIPPLPRRLSGGRLPSRPEYVGGCWGIGDRHVIIPAGQFEPPFLTRTVLPCWVGASSCPRSALSGAVLHRATPDHYGTIVQQAYAVGMASLEPCMMSSSYLAHRCRRGLVHANPMLSHPVQPSDGEVWSRIPRDLHPESEMECLDEVTCRGISCPDGQHTNTTFSLAPASHPRHPLLPLCPTAELLSRPSTVFLYLSSSPNPIHYNL